MSTLFPSAMKGLRRMISSEGLNNSETPEAKAAREREEHERHAEERRSRIATQASSVFEVHVSPECNL